MNKKMHIIVVNQLQLIVIITRKKIEKKEKRIKSTLLMKNKKETIL